MANKERKHRVVIGTETEPCIEPAVSDDDGRYLGVYMFEDGRPVHNHNCYGTANTCTLWKNMEKGKPWHVGYGLETKDMPDNPGPDYAPPLKSITATPVSIRYYEDKLIRIMVVEVTVTTKPATVEEAFTAYLQAGMLKGMSKRTYDSVTQNVLTRMAQAKEKRTIQ
jgi:hypothetical protein